MAETNPHSYRTILRSSSIIGSASLVDILNGIIRAKVIAVLLGPAGIGLMGMFGNLMQTASTLAALGIGNSGSRQIAEANANGSDHAVLRTRKALLSATICLALIGAGTFWLGRYWIADTAFGGSIPASTVGWLALGLALSVAGGSQIAYLGGMRQVGDIARLRIFSALGATAIAIPLVTVLGQQAILPVVLIAPAVSFILGHYFVRRQLRGSKTLQSHGLALHELFSEWKSLIGLGLAFMLSTLVIKGAEFVLRVLVLEDLGTDAVGWFQASWAIGMMYLNFVLAAMGVDYYPRLVGAIKEPSNARQMINEQTEVALLFGGGFVLGMLSLAPLAITILYSNDFAPAAKILRYQLIGDVLKLVSWPLGIALLALGRGRTYILTQTCAAATLVGVTYLLLPIAGIEATGIAFVAMYVVVLPINLFVVARDLGFRWKKEIVLLLTFLLATSIGIVSLSHYSDFATALIGGSIAVIFTAFGLLRVVAMAGIGGRAGRIAAIFAASLQRLGLKN